MILRASTLKFAMMAGISMIGVQAMAQEAATPAQPAQSGPASFEEIVVTANRRAENIQKVPLSVAVLQSDTLSSAGISNAIDLQVVTTNMQIGNNNNNPLVYIRGMGSANLGPGSEAPVGLYQDGVYVPFSMSIDQSFLDVERVEVLKGPQGTLYGRNTTAGAINIITRDPSAKRAFETRLSIGTWGNQQLQGYFATGPGRVSASIAGDVTRHNPYMRNLSTGPDLNDRKQVAVRGKVKFEASEAWDATLAMGYARRRDHAGQGFVSYTDRPAAADPALGGRFTTMDNPRRTYQDFNSFGSRSKDFDVSLNIRGELGFADFVSITGYRDHKNNESPDADATDLAQNHFGSRIAVENYSQEFQLISPSDSPIEWITGLYAFHSNGGFDHVEVFLPGNTGSPRCCGTVTADGPSDASLIVKSRAKAEALAAYGQLSYPILDGLKLTGGIRYSWEKRSLLVSNVSIPGFGVFSADPTESATFDSLDPKAGIEYSWGRQMIYGSFSKGFRSGGYNIGSPGDPGPVKPEKVTAFEVGGKHTLLPGVLFNWAMFKYKYKDLQVSIVQNDGAGSLFTTQNAASAKIKGAEVDLTVNAVPRLSANIGVGYTDAKYSSYPNASAYLPVKDGYGFVPTLVDVGGRPLTRAPKWTASAQATYSIPIQDDRVDISSNVYYTSGYYIDTPSNVRQSGFAVVNLRAMYFLSGDHVSVGAFVNNLTNKTYIMSTSTSAYSIIVTPSDPRIIGATIALKY